MDVVVFANAVNAVGVFFGLLAHAYISFTERARVGHGLYLVSCSLILVGSYLLESWPVVALNVGWGAIALYGFVNASDLKLSSSLTSIGDKVLLSSLIIGAYALLIGDYDLAGFMVTSIYITAYALFTANRYSNIGYIWWCSIGFLFLIPHLLEVDQYSVLIGESIGFIIGLFGLIKFYLPIPVRK